MINFQNLLFNHQSRVDAIVDRYLAKYKDLANPKTVYTWNLFLLENSKDVIADLSQSSIDVFHEAIPLGADLNRTDFNAIREINLAGAARYQETLKGLYDVILQEVRS